MKRKILISMMAIVMLLSLSCGNKKGSPASGDSGSTTGFIENNVPETVAAAAGSIGYALRMNTSLYILETNTGEESDKTKWADSLILGERVMVGKVRRLTFGGDGKVYEFAEVRRDDGKEGFVFVSQVAADSTLAVVVDEKANLYKTAKTTNVTGDIISRKTVVAVLSGTESSGFVEIKAYDPVAERSRQSFIRLNFLSMKDSDIQSSILLQIAQPLKNTGADKIRKDALLEAALLDYPDSVFNAEIMALVNPNAAVAIKTESPIRSSMTVNDNNVNVCDLPDPVAGKSVGQLNNGDIVTISEQTANTSTIDGQSAHWYRITDPLEGWVFGAYLE
jgi:hypothetical protein